jgi:hypothetical protein
MPHRLHAECLAATMRGGERTGVRVVYRSRYDAENSLKTLSSTRKLWLGSVNPRRVRERKLPVLKIARRKASRKQTAGHQYIGRQMPPDLTVVLVESELDIPFCWNPEDRYRNPKTPCSLDGSNVGLSAPSRSIPCPTSAILHHRRRLRTNGSREPSST